MASRKKKRSNGKRGLTIPVAVVAGFAVPVSKAYTRFKNEGVQGGVNAMVNYFTGFQPNDGGWNANHLQYGLLPVVVGLAVHKVASALGVNRVLSGAGIPILRI